MSTEQKSAADYNVGDTVIARFNPHKPKMTVLGHRPGEALRVRKIDARGEVFGPALTLPAFALADASEPVYKITKCVERVDAATGDVIARDWFTRWYVAGLDAARIVISANVAQADRWNYYVDDGADERCATELFN